MTCRAFVAIACAFAAPSLHAQVTQIPHTRAKDLTEASGLIASRAHPGILWTHNDGGDGVLFAIRADGSTVGTINVDAKFRDFEDIAADASGNLYLADSGNNDANRKFMEIHRIAEPDPTKGGKVKPTATWRLTFPAKPFN